MLVSRAREVCVPRSVLIPLVLVLAGGCDDTVYPGGGGGGGGGHAPDWDGVQEYLDAHCYSCHANGIGTGAFPEDIEAEADPDFADERLLLTPGDPDNSPLWISLTITESTADGIDPMPLGRTSAIDITAIQHIKLWIYDGAPLDSAE